MEQVKEVTNVATTADTSEVEKTRKALMEAIFSHSSIRAVSMRYALFVTASMKNKTHASKKLGCDRRSLQRWAKEVEAVTPPEAS